MRYGNSQGERSYEQRMAGRLYCHDPAQSDESKGQEAEVKTNEIAAVKAGFRRGRDTRGRDQGEIDRQSAQQAQEDPDPLAVPVSPQIP